MKDKVTGLGKILIWAALLTVGTLGEPIRAEEPAASAWLAAGLWPDTVASRQFSTQSAVSGGEGEQGAIVNVMACVCRTRCISVFNGCRSGCYSGPNFAGCARVCTDRQTACFRRCGC
jgi:hypothetical protein